MPRPPRRARACMRASERTARSHERPRSTLLSEGRFDPPHATAPGHDAVGVAQREADPREPSARPATSDRPAAQKGVAAAPRLITNAPNASPRRDPNTADGGSRRVGARFEPTRRRQAARRARGQDGSGPGVCPCSAARASRPRRAKGVVARARGLRTRDGLANLGTISLRMLRKIISAPVYRTAAAGAVFHYGGKT